MREVLFRGKRVDNGEWVEGELLHDMKGRPWIYWTTPKELPVFFLRSAIVKSETVGEYTGLTDKNGKKIFEGDILSDGDDTYKVVFDEGVFRIENSHYTTGVYVAIHIDKIDEVIGNIHDNPEFLEVEK